MVVLRRLKGLQNIEMATQSFDLGFHQRCIISVEHTKRIHFHNGYSQTSDLTQVILSNLANVQMDKL